MNVKRWIVWLCLALLLVSEVGLFVINQQRSTAQAALSASKEEIAQLQSQLDQFQNSSAMVQSNELARVRKQNETLSQNLAGAQNSITQLRTANQKLTQQFQNTLTAAQQQQDQLQQLAAENQQAQAVAQQQQLVRSEAQIAAAQRNACINNLRQIDAAKNQWALENNKTAGDLPTLTDLAPYLKDGIFPACPAGGLYSINAVGEPPTCSVPGHVLP
jgi:hypothetical protein